MTGQEKLKEYSEALQEAKKAQDRVSNIENELCQMVHAFFADCRGSWYYRSMKYGENTTSLCVEEVIMGEGEDYCFLVPTSIILKYLDGNTEEAVKEFQKWHKEYWEQKHREEEHERQESEYNLFLKLKQKFE